MIAKTIIGASTKDDMTDLVLCAGMLVILTAVRRPSLFSRFGRTAGSFFDVDFYRQDTALRLKKVPNPKSIKYMAESNEFLPLIPRGGLEQLRCLVSRNLNIEPWLFV